MAQIKGTAIRGLLRRAKESYPGGIPALVKALPPASRAAFERRILAGDWYPYTLYGDLLAAFVPPGPHQENQLRDLGRKLAAQDAGTTFKAVALFASVERMLERGSLFWSRHCDTGSFETQEMERGAATGALRGFPEVSPLHCRLLAGWIEGMALAAGARTASAQKTRCVHRGDELCEYRGHWT